MPVVASLLIALSVIVITGNYFGIIRWWRTGINYSCIPLLGGLFGFVGLILVADARFLAWLPMVVDPGSAPMAVLCIRKAASKK